MARFTHPAFGDVGGLTTTIHSYSPTWSGTGLTFTGTPATGSYIKIGNFVMVQIDTYLLLTVCGALSPLDR